METEVKRLGHVMIDLETMGRISHAVICSIGAVEFDITTGELGREFYMAVNIQSCLDKGMIVNGDTIEWWMMQSDAARKLIYLSTTNKISFVLERFQRYLEDLGINNIQLWGNGATFDLGILAEAYRLCGRKEPWDFRNERDVRTIVMLAPEIKMHYPKYGTEHNPIDDCKYQIGYLSEIYKKIRILTVGV